MKFKAAIILTYCMALPATYAQADDAALTPDVPTRIASTFGSTFGGALGSTLGSTLGNVLARTQDLVLNAMGMMGIPYIWGGSTPEAGFDCSGFVQYVVKQALGIALPRSSFDQVKAGQAVERYDLQPGDLVFFNTMRAPNSHVGIYVGESRFIHAPSRGKTVEIGDINNVYWQQRFTGARRLPM